MNFRRKINALKPSCASRAKACSRVGAALVLVCAQPFAQANVGANGMTTSLTNTNQAAPKVAVVSTTRPTNATRQPNAAAATSNQTFAALQAAPQQASNTVNAAAVPVTTAQSVYKFIDAQGRTHYVDGPVSGAQKVNLPELTIMDSQWPTAGSKTAAANLSSTNITATPLAPPISETANPPLPTSSAVAPQPAKPAAKPQPTPFSMIPVGKIPTANASSTDDAEPTPMPSVKLLLASNSYSAPQQLAAPQSDEPQRTTPAVERFNPQAEADTQQFAALQRRKMFESELRQEENLARDIRQTLTKEEAESAAIRAKTQELANAVKKNITPSATLLSAKTELLAHFERKRLLQDALATHERTADALREVLRAR